MSFPKRPWDWDGFSPPFRGYVMQDAKDLFEGNLGVVDFKNIGVAPGGDALQTSRKYVRPDFGVKGPWQDLMDSRIEPDRGTDGWWQKVETAAPQIGRRPRNRMIERRGNSPEE